MIKKFFEKYFSLSGDLKDKDEYQKQEIYKILANSSTLFYWSVIIALFINFLNEIRSNPITFGGFSLGTVSLIIIIFVNLTYLGIATECKMLNDEECYDKTEYKTKLKKLRKKTMALGIPFFIIPIAFDLIIFYIKESTLHFHYETIKIHAINSLVFTVGFYLSGKSKVKKYYN